MQLLRSFLSLQSEVRLATIPVIGFCFPFFFFTNPHHLLRRDGANNIYSWENASTAYNLERWSTSYLPTIVGLQSICSRQMAPTIFNLKWWNPKQLLMRVTTFTHNVWSKRRFLFPFIFTNNPQHLQRREWVHSIYEIWSLQHWLPRYGTHSIFSCEMEYTVYTHETWIT